MDNPVKMTKLKLPKRGSWGGYIIERIGPRTNRYFWIGKGDNYLMALTTKEAEKLAKFLLSK